MAGALSDVGEALVRRWMFSTSAMTSTNVRPVQWFLALYTSAPSDAGGGTEVSTSGTGYSRQEITFDANGAANASDITFGPATADWGTVTHGAIFDDQGRFLAWTSVGSSQAIPSGDSVTLAAGAVTVEFD